MDRNWAVPPSISPSLSPASIGWPPSPASTIFPVNASWKKSAWCANANSRAAMAAHSCCTQSSILGTPRKAVGAPILAADAMVREEESVGIVSVLDRPQPRVVGAPEGALPVLLKVVRLRNIGARLGHEL